MDKGYNKNVRYIQNNSCPSNTSQNMTVGVPISVRAIADIGNISFTCMGTTVMTNESDSNTVSNFTIYQRIQVDIPIVCSAEANVGEEQVCFENPQLLLESPKETNTYNCTYNNNCNSKRYY